MNDENVAWALGRRSAVRKEEPLPLAATWVGLEGTMLNEISRQRKTNTV